MDNGAGIFWWDIWNTINAWKWNAGNGLLEVDDGSPYDLMQLSYAPFTLNSSSILKIDKVYHRV